MNNKYSNNFNTLKTKISLAIFIISLFIICFLLSYFVSDYLTNPKYRVENDNYNNKTVYNETSNYLDDNIFVTLKTIDNIDFSESLSKLKNVMNLEGNLTLDSLSKELSKVGYKLSDWNEAKLIYVRSEEVNSTSLEPNKYYLGAEEGYISIFKTDENGKVIEEEKKVYTEYKPLSDLPEIDQEAIKNNEFFFDTKDEALIKLSEMVS
ncbi:hypothetical protein [Clostridium isatidis]|uniref:hypothetical protein n=1 Tax=Clostridium isatidis TaxID=182773 RepID=UPI003AACEBB6